ncbi:hypothetical protein [Peromfec virus RodF8_10]|uniref:Uncharacterized protein n=1 Tax=Peromfec virus RodF8_10 TaxID=2929357 RepID=A0A976N369_9VIRU|nr:hypothetical protein [Peromfec virus RodF8_10]
MNDSLITSLQTAVILRQKLIQGNITANDACRDLGLIIRELKKLI